MKHSVELEYEVVDKLIVADLVNQLDSMLKDPWALYHCYKLAAQDISGFFTVIRFYTTSKEFEEICLNRKEKLEKLLVKVKESTCVKQR